jgi:orotate phosphoribosyltransferase
MKQMKFSDQLSRSLLQSKAIIIDPAKPFTWASGWRSPIYCDNRKTLSYPEIRNFIRTSLSQLIKDHFDPPDIIAGVATGAIAHGALVAEKLDLPFIYVRSSAKEHGTGKLIEGDPGVGKSVVVVEDLISTGGSSLRAVDSLRSEGLDVLGMVAIFTYGFPVAEESFKKAGVALYTLGNYENLVSHGIESGYIRSEYLNTLMEWRKDPGSWGKK